jgi:hypothetical protein
LTASVLKETGNFKTKISVSQKIPNMEVEDAVSRYLQRHCSF